MRNIYITLLSVFSLLFVSCEDFDRMNTDPDNPSTMNPARMVLLAQYEAGSNWQHTHRLFIYPGGFMQQWTGNYAMTEYGGKGRMGANSERLWIDYYPTIIKNLVDVEYKWKNNPEYVNIVSMATILKVQNALKLTDYYGDIPYSEAGLVFYEDIIKPKYDTQESIYRSFLTELKNATNSFDANKQTSSEEYYYQGDLNQWKKLGNSLRLRIAMRLVKVDPTTAQLEAEDAIKSGVLESAADDCFVPYQNEASPASGKGRGNPVANLLISNNRQFWFTSEFISMLEKNNDPRLSRFARVYFAGNEKFDITVAVRARRSSYAGMAPAAQTFSYTANPDYPLDNSSFRMSIQGRDTVVSLANSRLRASTVLTAYDNPFVYLSYAEVQFLMAEAAQRGWNVGGGTAASHYNKAIEASLSLVGRYKGGDISSSEIQAYLAEPNIAYDPSQGIEQINNQLWILHFLDPLEAWSNFRRSGYPKMKFRMIDPGVNQTNGNFPRRMPYPLEEQIVNNANLQDAISRIPGGTDDWTKPVWWDKD